MLYSLRRNRIVVCRISRQTGIVAKKGMENMSENTPSSDNGGLNDPLKLRNTDTGTLKRVPAATPAMASSAARKTIKLKPLAPSPNADGSVSTATIPMGQQPPRTVSTATIPMASSPKPAPMPPPKPSVVATTTQGIARPKPVAPAKPSVVSTTTQGIARPKPVAPAKPSVVSTTTQGIARPKPVAPAKPSAAPTSTQGIAKPKPVTVTPPPANPSPVPTTTQEIGKASSHSTLAAVHQSGLQTAKPAIKLRPSAAPAEPSATGSSAASQTIKLAPKPASTAEAASASAQTLKLTPKTPSTVSPVPPQPEEEAGETKTIRMPKKTMPAPSAAPASAQTIKLMPKTPSTVSPVPPQPQEKAEAPAESAAPQAPKMPKLSIPSKAPVAPQPSDPTVSIHVQQDIPTTKNEAVQAEEQAIQIDQEKADEEARAQAALREAARKAEPSIFFTVCACLTLVLMLYVVYAMSAQFFNQWSEKSIPVFGFEQISQK